MPCWTRRKIQPATVAVLDEKGLLNVERLNAAAAEIGVTVRRRADGTIELRDRSRRDAATVERLVRQGYSRLTVEAGLRKHGFRVKKTQTTQRATVKLTVGR